MSTLAPTQFFSAPNINILHNQKGVIESIEPKRHGVIAHLANDSSIKVFVRAKRDNLASYNSEKPTLVYVPKNYDLFSDPTKVIGVEIVMNVDISHMGQPVATHFAPYQRHGLPEKNLNSNITFVEEHKPGGKTMDVQVIVTPPSKTLASAEKDERPIGYIRVKNPDGHQLFCDRLEVFMKEKAYGPGCIFETFIKNKRKQRGYEVWSIKDPRLHKGRIVRIKD